METKTKTQRNTDEVERRLSKILFSFSFFSFGKWTRERLSFGNQIPDMIRLRLCYFFNLHGNDTHCFDGSIHSTNEKFHSYRFWIESSGRREKKTISLFALAFVEIYILRFFLQSALAAEINTQLFSMHSCRVPTVSAAAVRTHYWL